MSQLLVTESYLKFKSLINDNVDMKILTPVIEWVQDFKIIPILGQELFDEIVTQSTPTVTLTPANQTLLDDHILKTMIHFIMSDAVISMTYRFTNVGMVKRGVEDAPAITSQEAKDLQDYYKNKGEEYAERMRKFIRKNIDDYPTYYSNTSPFDIKPQESGYDIGIFLPKNNSDYSTEDLKRIDRYNNQGFL